MPLVNQRLIVGQILPKYDRTYRAADRESSATYEVNVARLTCTCPEFNSTRTAFPPDDARRVCAHIYDKLYSTKVERSFDPIVQLFIRYGRTMPDYRVVEDDFGQLVIGQPFGPRFIRAIGLVDQKAVLATYDLRAGEWSQGETELSPEIEAGILARMRGCFPKVFGA